MIYEHDQPSLFVGKKLPTPIRADRDTGDITARRHRNAETSVQANTRVNKALERSKVLEAIRQRGNATSKEIAADLGKGLNAVSPRISELLADKKLWFIKGDVRDGCRILRIR